MSTPIEIVRAQWDWMRADYTNGAIAPHGWEEYDTALAAVLRDAERFAALERAHGRGDVHAGWCQVGWGGEFDRAEEPLAELADRLREATK